MGRIEEDVPEMEIEKAKPSVLTKLKASAPAARPVAKAAPLREAR